MRGVLFLLTLSPFALACAAPETVWIRMEDPLNLTDVAEAHPDIVEWLATELTTWHEWALSLRPPPDSEAIEGLSAEEIARLRSLGYINNWGGSWRARATPTVRNGGAASTALVAVTSRVCRRRSAVRQPDSNGCPR